MEGLGLEEGMIFLFEGKGYENRKYPIHLWENRSVFSSPHIERATSLVRAMPVTFLSIIHIRLVNTKPIPRLQHIRFRPRLENLFLLPFLLGTFDASNPVLDLNRHAHPMLEHVIRRGPLRGL
jgi:hypothetical protein